MRKREQLNFSNKIVTVPNILTVLRILLAPFFIMSIISGDLLLSMIIFFAAAATDSLDGFIARHFKSQSLVGKFIDPMADKLLMTVAYVLLTIDFPVLERTIPLWLTVLVIGRDLTIVTGSTIVKILNGHIEISPLKISKFTTFLEVSTIFLTLLLNHVGFVKYLFEFFILSTALFCVLSTIGYIRVGIRQLEEL